MAAYLGYGEVRFPTQGSTEIQERVKHFESDDSFDDLQQQMNTWLFLISTNAVEDRPSIRNISFTVFERQQNPNKGDFHYFSQIHYFLVGDANDEP